MSDNTTHTGSTVTQAEWDTFYNAAEELELTNKVYFTATEGRLKEIRVKIGKEINDVKMYISWDNIIIITNMIEFAEFIGMLGLTLTNFQQDMYNLIITAAGKEGIKFPEQHRDDLNTNKKYN